MRARPVPPADALRDRANPPYLAGGDRSWHEDLEATRIGRLADDGGGPGRRDAGRLAAVVADGDRLVVGDPQVGGDEHARFPEPDLPHPLVGEREVREDRHRVDAAFTAPAMTARADAAASQPRGVALPGDVHEVRHHRAA
ncbi:hypothetical protein QLQ12_34335 [Actinoplanes sp. NEAU-A12]|uniref:Uncharacterized protein n=1 Tax=Actinoplanes sandaracinus TaxID=3045177 RepID=A0ABT6WVD5_9ACTN|nr:hypothetical protein [Actinoplanes sandaracinus]MDI6103705.1 hypothetical protein [Actinoplanes sandaracinus]